MALKARRSDIEDVEMGSPNSSRSSLGRGSDNIHFDEVPNALRQRAKDVEGTEEHAAEEAKRDVHEEMLHHYFMSSTIKVEKLDSVQETIDVMVYMKLHYKIPDFAKRVIFQAEHDFVQGGISFKFNSDSDAENEAKLAGICNWLSRHEPGSEDPPEEKEKTFRQCRIQTSESSHCPVNLQSIISNAVGGANYEETLALCWVQYNVPKASINGGSVETKREEAADSDGEGGKSAPPRFREEVDDALDGLLVMQVAFRATVKSVLNMREFPFDRHVIPLGVSSRQWTTHSERQGGIAHIYHHKWVLELERLKVKIKDKAGRKIEEDGWSMPKWAEPYTKVYSEQRFVVNEDTTLVDDSEEFDHLKPCLQAGSLRYWKRRRRSMAESSASMEEEFVASVVDEEHFLPGRSPQIPEALAKKRKEAEKKWIQRQWKRRDFIRWFRGPHRYDKKDKEEAPNEDLFFDSEKYVDHIDKTAKIGDRLGILKPRLCIRLQRDPTPFFINIALPIFVVIMLCLSTFFLGFNNVELRIEAILISALAAAAYRTAVSAQIPAKTYFMVGDAYFVATYIFLGIFCFKVVLAYQGLNKDGVGFFWYDGKGGGDDDDDDDEGFTSKKRRYQDMDDFTSWVLLIVWVIGHFFLMLEFMVPQEYRVVSRAFHPTWETKMILSHALCDDTEYANGYNNILHPDQMEKEHVVEKKRD